MKLPQYYLTLALVAVSFVPLSAAEVSDDTKTYRPLAEYVGELRELIKPQADGSLNTAEFGTLSN